MDIIAFYVNRLFRHTMVRELSIEGYYRLPTQKLVHILPNHLTLLLTTKRFQFHNIYIFLIIYICIIINIEILENMLHKKSIQETRNRKYVNQGILS